MIASEELALVRGWDTTRTTLRHWRARPLAVLGPWVLGSFAIALLLLTATWLVATVSTPDPAVWAWTGRSDWGDFWFILYRNGLVLSLHAMACVAGFIAGSSLPIDAWYSNQVASSSTYARKGLVRDATSLPHAPA